VAEKAIGVIKILMNRDKANVFNLHLLTSSIIISFVR